jgi:hypothetical protein
MGFDLPEPNEHDDIDCHLQQIGMGTLVCRAVKQTGRGTTNEVTPQICFNCAAGKIYREVGCDAVLPRIRIHSVMGGSYAVTENLFCKIRKRDTTLEYCQTCELVNAETTRVIVSKTRGLFEAQGFHSAYHDLEKAREALRDGNPEHAITKSITCLESTMRICHDELGVPLPDKKQVSDLWKSTREHLKFAEIDAEGTTERLMNSLSGVTTNLGALRNSLGDAHGKGKTSVAVSESIAELALNTAATMSTLIIRRFNQVREV